MKYHKTPLPGLILVELEPVEDERGSFSRIFCREEFGLNGLPMSPPVQANLTYNRRKGTFRGFHYQAAPHEEDKLVRIVAGAVFDMAVDIRPGSPTYGRLHGVELSAANRLALFIPKGFAHAYQTLTDHSEMLYMVSAPYQPGCGRGFRWNDPFLAGDWPLPSPVVISGQDQSWPDFQGL